MTPLLVLLFGFHPGDRGRHRPALRVGHKERSAPPSTASGKTVDWRIVGGSRRGSVPAAIATLVRDGPFRDAGRDQRLRPAQPAARRALLADRRRGLLPRQDHRLGRPTIDAMERPASDAGRCCSALVLGVLVSITSVGAGALGTTALLILYPQAARRAHRRQRHRARGAADADRRHRPLADGLGRFRPDGRRCSSARSPAIIVGSLLGSRASDSVLTPVLAVTCWSSADGCSRAHEHWPAGSNRSTAL